MAKNKLLKCLPVLLLLVFSLFLPTQRTFGQVIVTCAGGGPWGFGGDGGPAVYASLYNPYGINLDDSSNLYICDVNNSRIRKVTHPNILGVGIITTIAGNGSAGYSGDGFQATDAEINGPVDVATDQLGNIYIADGANYCVRKVASNGIITTIAGTGTSGYNGDNIAATAAELNSPNSIAVDSAGNLYIADVFGYRIRKVDTAGIITTIAGIGITGFSPDASLADTAKMWPYLVRFSKAGIIYFADSARIRTINNAGIITTVAGNGVLGYSGDNGPATAAAIGPSAIALDDTGNIYFADGASDRVRKIGTSGIISTIAGNGTSGFYGDNGPPLLAEFDVSDGIAVGNTGNIYISDQGNQRIRLVTLHPEEVNKISNEKEGIAVYPNPASRIFYLMVAGESGEMVTVAIANVLGEKLTEFSVLTNIQKQIEYPLKQGIYFISATTPSHNYTQKIVIQ